MRRYLLALIVVTVCAGMCSCIGVVPMRQRTVAQHGPIANIDLQFLKQGQTTPREVLDKLKAVDAGFVSDSFFFGRWRTSKSAAWIAVGTPAGYGGFRADRLWRNTNLLIQFDGNGVVQGYEMFPDKMLAEKLAPLVRERKLSEPEHLEATLTLNGTEIPVNLVLSRESLELEETAHFRNLKNRAQYHYSVPRQDFQGITISHFQDNVTYLDVSFRFVRDLRQFNGPRGHKVTLQLSVPELTTVLAYASLQAPQSDAAPH